jgi:MFS family permease
MTMLRLLPMGLFGAFIGAWAEKIERRVTLIVVVMLMLTTSVVLALLAYGGHLAMWHLAAASFLNGLGWATDNPVRRVMIGDVVGGSRMSTAMSLDVGANNASRMVGPTVGGLLVSDRSATRRNDGRDLRELSPLGWPSVALEGGGFGRC